MYDVDAGLHYKFVKTLLSSSFVVHFAGKTYFPFFDEIFILQVKDVNLFSCFFVTLPLKISHWSSFLCRSLLRRLLRGCLQGYSKLIRPLPIKIYFKRKRFAEFERMKRSVAFFMLDIVKDFTV